MSIAQCGIGNVECGMKGAYAQCGIRNGECGMKGAYARLYKAPC